MPDIDIDFADRNLILSKIEHRVATQDGDKKHNTGIYVTEIPCNPINNYSTIDYKHAEERGYFKIDFLNVSIYQDVKDEAHLKKLMDTEPLWDLLEHDDFTDQLFQVASHAHVLKRLKPKSVEQLAAVLAIIRPAKRYLIDSNWDQIFEEVWQRPEDDQYFFKKSHAIAYSMLVIVHMNLICEKLSST